MPKSEIRAGNAQGFFRTLLTPPFRFMWKVTTEGMEHIPSDGGAIIAPNHISVLDSFFVPLTIPRRITYVGKAEYMDDWKTRWLFPAMGMVPIDRSGGDSATGALDTAAGVLESGELFGIYPEGTRSRSGKLHKGHTGVARVALRTGVPIVPVGIIGTDTVQRPDAKVPKPFCRVHIRFGRPIDVARYSDRANDRLVLRQIADELMYEIRNLSGQEYIDSYATKATKPAVEQSKPAQLDTAPSEPALSEIELGETPETPVSPESEPATIGSSSAQLPADGDMAEVIPLRVRPQEEVGEGIPMPSLAPSAAALYSDGSAKRSGTRATDGEEDDSELLDRRSSASVLVSRPLEPA